MFHVERMPPAGRPLDVPRGTHFSPRDEARHAARLGSGIAAETRPGCSTGNTLTASADSAAELLRSGAQQLHLELAPEQHERLVALAELLATWAPRINLTGHRSADGIVRRLVLDAMAMEPQLPPAQSIADLGSGAGFPGLPLAVLRPNSSFVLVEARERRHHFQRAAIRALGLGNVRALRGRIEQLEPETCDGVVAQALAQPTRAVQLALRWCRPGGWIAIPGAEQPPAPGVVAGVGEAEERHYRLPISGIQRTLWLGRRDPAPATPA